MITPIGDQYGDYLHPIDKQPNEAATENWTEIDLATWGEHDKDYPVKLTLLRRLNESKQEPQLHELMFTNLYKNIAINQLILDIPEPGHTTAYRSYQLQSVKVFNYAIIPCHSSDKKAYEKIVLVAKHRRELD